MLKVVSYDLATLTLSSRKSHWQKTIFFKILGSTADFINVNHWHKFAVTDHFLRYYSRSALRPHHCEPLDPMITKSGSLPLMDSEISLKAFSQLDVRWESEISSQQIGCQLLRIWNFPSIHQFDARKVWFSRIPASFTTAPLVPHSRWSRDSLHGVLY